MSEELKPCPFCGKPAKWEKKFLIGGIARCSDYQCIGAFTHLSRSASSGEWNTRPIEDALKAENERLKNALQEIADLRMVNPNLKESAHPSSCSEDMFVNFYCKMGDIATKALGKDTNVPAKKERL